jgi:type III pantothenate kinase
MRLEVDAGNTFVKWRLLNKDNVIMDRGMINNGEDAVAIFSSMYFFPQVKDLLIANVSSSDLARNMSRVFAAKNSLLRVYNAQAEKEMCGVEFIYQDVGRLGVDRCLAMVAAYDKFKGGVLVIDCGSAMTADIVLATGKHVGGYIFPGFRLLKQSLLSGTYKVIVNAEVEPSYKLGVNTEECVDNGSHMMIKSTLHGLIELAAGYDISDVLITGGDGLKAKALVGEGCGYDKDLVFKGLGMASSYSLD